MEAVKAQNSRLSEVLVPMLIAASATMFLFYIDEGYYDFRWMNDFGNWFVFFIYLGILTGAQVLMGRLFFRRFKGWTRGILTGATGLVLGVAFAFYIFS